MTQLRLEGVSKTYQRGRRRCRALSEVSLQVTCGEFVAIHGEPRSGKSTLLRIAAGIEVPDRGRVVYNEKDLATLSDRALATYRMREVAWVSATRPSLPGYRAIEYVALPVLADRGRSEGQRHAFEALCFVDAEGCADAPLDELSESERQRVAIAQAVVRRPRILVVDEPAAGLAMTESRAILDLLRELAHSQALGVLITASDASELLGATRVLGLLSGGRIVDPGPTRTAGGDLLAFPRRSTAHDA